MKKKMLCSGTGGPVHTKMPIPTCPVCYKMWPLKRTRTVPRHHIKRKINE